MTTPAEELPVSTDYYRVKMMAGGDGCTHCGAGQMWTIVYVEHGATEETELGQAWGDRELADDICDLMNMAFESGLEVPPQRETCEWSEIEAGSAIYNTCKEGEEFHCTPGMDLHPHCQWCGGAIVVTG